MSHFKKGQTVVATTTAQGMKSGSEYRVTEVHYYPFGVRLYDLMNAADGTPLGRVGNLHLLARVVEACS